MFSKYRVTSQYGWRNHPIQNIRKFHGGIDLVDYHKAPIKPFVSGTVIYAGNGVSGSGVGGYGNVVVIRDSKGYAHVYAHLNSVNTKKGNKVTLNSIIGYQGATGQVTGSHLHYEVRKKSSPSLGWTSKPENSTVDPVRYAKNFNQGTSNSKGERFLEKLVEDGKEGRKTIMRGQQFMGTVVDGIISPTSNYIKALQRFLNTYEKTKPKLTVDGKRGRLTIIKWQAFMGTVQDGVISPTSNLIRAWQKFLNQYGR